MKNAFQELTFNTRFCFCNKQEIKFTWDFNTSFNSNGSSFNEVSLLTSVLPSDWLISVGLWQTSSSRLLADFLPTAICLSADDKSWKTEWSSFLCKEPSEQRPHVCRSRATLKYSASQLGALLHVSIVSQRQGSKCCCNSSRPNDSLSTFNWTTYCRHSTKALATALLSEVLSRTVLWEKLKKKLYWRNKT